ncbi:MAG: transglycosylase SLT domain-containing protein [Beijerinckiaceae bacterium]
MFLFTNQTPVSAKPSVNDALPHAGSLKQASRATGVSFDYLAKTAERESGFNPQAKASTSSATGLFQFIEQTWLGVVKQEGGKIGLGNEAAAILSENGRLSVADPALRQRILSLREDPSVSAMMAGAFAAKNGQKLQESLGRKATEGELYLAHFLGPSGARDLINLAEKTPDAKAAAAFQDAAAANRNIFFDKSGRARAASEVYSNITGAFSQNPTSAPKDTAATSAKAHEMFRVKGEGKPLHGLFRSSGEPVSEAVIQNWGSFRKASQTSDTRVPFFPRETTAAGAARVSLAPELAISESGNRSVTVPLPPRRPATINGTQNLTELQNLRRTVPKTSSAQPLDLLRFVKANRLP